MPESTFRELADNAPVMIWRSAPDKLCDWFNKPWLDFTGRTMEQEVGNGWAEGVHPDDFEHCLGIYTSAFDAREKFSMTYRLRRHDGAWRWLLDNGAPYNRNGAFAGYFGTCIDVTEQREEHGRLVDSLRERDALIREVYHRVKNNLQQIEGLIAIERATMSDPGSVRSLDALSGRVRAMGGVHQMLMRSKSMSSVSVRDFITELCADVARSQGADARGVQLSVLAEACEVNIERAVILGLLVNELATNALKHAFPDGRSGRITVRYETMHETGAILEVVDDGVGMVLVSGRPASAGRTGFRLVEGFVDQLNGQLTIDGSSGAAIRVTLPAGGAR